ncbi:precorrin-3B C(17)-methyltransferase [Clostridium fallax]|uniref:Cobalt-precorrin 3 C17-methyltransferase n=1 Tax=Clostridium fallax TaxID=1533 RepID=A0A1M4Y1U5_9CLOT|nr:precorrin-3B C(17)-methyltransferase [Clostridium fallax]SHE99731.1 cobalt-precorrin 3 C17-methyltransferase [Clostridium fallax]SQB07779.1 precorrin-3B C(17)-methyltransferase [Clostridium fallax]
MGKLYVIGIGPGSVENMSLRAYNTIKKCNVIVGYTKYIEMIKELIEGKEVHSTGMKSEEDRCKLALELAKDNDVALVSTGDSGIYGMAGLILELSTKEDNIEIIPGITASSAAGSVLGAPLMHDNCNISLSDLLTPYEDIKKRVDMAAASDFIISLYNPRSKGRPHYLKECIEIIKKYRDGKTPIAVVEHALREGQNIQKFTLEDFNDEVVNMMSIVIIGNSKSYWKDGYFITPRGYKIGNK